jgi:hypothetical protein
MHKIKGGGLGLSEAERRFSHNIKERFIMETKLHPSKKMHNIKGGGLGVKRSGT